MGDYINVDSLFMRETDLLCELKRLPLFVKKNSVTHMYASHILEHFSINDVKKILKISYNLLDKNGEMRISVPDFDKIASLYLAHKEEFKTKKEITWLGVIYGGQSSRYDFHKTGFNPNWLKKLLEEAGFRNIQEYDAVKFLSQYNIQDSSLYKKDFGDYISLNMVAYK
jgi:predicted SAM-dependent methyltransferase